MRFLTFQADKRELVNVDFFFFGPNLPLEFTGVPKNCYKTEMIFDQIGSLTS